MQIPRCWLTQTNTEFQLGQGFNKIQLTAEPLLCYWSLPADSNADGKEVRLTPEQHPERIGGALSPLLRCTCREEKSAVGSWVVRVHAGWPVSSKACFFFLSLTSKQL